MSILLLSIHGEVGEALVKRLVDEADEVGVIEDDARAASLWKGLGAFV